MQPSSVTDRPCASVKGTLAVTDRMAEGTIEQRRHPRIGLTGTRAACLIDTGQTKFSVCDVSKGGICFISDRNFALGRHLKLNVEFIFGADIEVIYCDMFMADEIFLEARYRVGARFISGALDDEMFSLLLQSLTG